MDTLPGFFFVVGLFSFFQYLGDLKLGNTYNHVKTTNAKVSFLGPFANR